ncbi:MAG: hypothetical protein Q9227_001956 [Pyrenula ochraceoflavens]
MVQVETDYSLEGGLKTISYEQTQPAKPPIPVSTSTSPTPLNGSSRSHDSLAEPADAAILTKKGSSAQLREDERRDSGLAPSRDSRITSNSDGPAAVSLSSLHSIPQIKIDNDSTSLRKKSSRGWKAARHKSPPASKNDTAAANSSFQGITLEIPTGDLDGFTASEIDFSKRGSIMLGGPKANQPAETSHGRLRPTNSTRRVKSNPAMRSQSAAKSLSVDEEILSQKVRSLYDCGVEEGSAWDQQSAFSRPNDTIVEEPALNENDHNAVSLSRATSVSDLPSNTSVNGRSPNRRRASFIAREENELAGGVEDWKDVENEDVDRYGFIVPRNRSPEAGQAKEGQARPPSSIDPQTLQRVSTTLQLVSGSPRRKRTMRRSPSNARNSTRSPVPDRSPSAQSTRPGSSQSWYTGSTTGQNSRLRTATNKLPHNKARRTMDEAGDMLTVPPSSASGTQSRAGTGKQDAYARRKEMEREDKWRKMAKVVSRGANGGGMIFEFDTHSSKVVERTWKGIPDSWRATAWYAFLSASARNRKDSPSDDQLIDAFHDYQAESSPDDYQIDLDVPRTINSHIMFRRRYRGGQRLLFRVLHAMSLHFPNTGYVQGMAALAVTLLAYYDEEKAFVMLVRLWQLRGLERLYKGGLSGLMEALEDFKNHWLERGEVAQKLDQLGIDPTAYGTRWYLTLFNYSIPFPAQLRVWDVFMLLGDSKETSKPTADASNFGTILDVLHATSAALIDGTRDILLESDFENAMNVLTSWIPIKDEDMFMRVARAEWKMHKGKG